jgi:hypothetical protein
MTTPESIDNTVLILSLPRVLGATRPVEGANIGVSLLIYDLADEGATVEVDPPLSGTMDPGDVMQLWLEDDHTLLDSEIIVDVNAKTTLRIPKDRLHPDRINELYYTITRKSQNIGTSTPPLTMLYNKIRPGLKDTHPEDGHSELKLLLPDVIRNGVGPDFVSARVCVSYPYCRAYDDVSLKCNGELMTYQVSKDEAPEPPNPGSAIPTTVYFTVTRNYLKQAQRPGNKLVFSYTVTDQIGNGPDTNAVWSASQEAEEDLDGLSLLMPILREIQSDVTDDPGIIDLEKLGPNPLWFIALTDDSRIQVGDTINATYTATIEGQPDVVVSPSGTVEADEFGQKNPCILQIPNNKVITGSKVTATYGLFRGGVEIGKSRTATAKVIGPELHPEITSVRDSKNNEIPNGESTVDVTVTLSGNGRNDQRVEVFDNASSQGIALVDSDGDWSKTVTGLVEGTHSFIVKSLYGNGLESSPWSLTRRAPLEVADPNVSLRGTQIISAPVPYNPQFSRTKYVIPGTTDVRIPTGGKPPYTYTSSNPNIVTVEQTGVMSSTGNGRATITIRDSVGDSVVIQVQCENVYQLLAGNLLYTFSAYEEWLTGTDCVPPGASRYFNAIQFAYEGFPADAFPSVYWSLNSPNYPGKAYRIKTSGVPIGEPPYLQGVIQEHIEQGTIRLKPLGIRPKTGF